MKGRLRTADSKVLVVEGVPSAEYYGAAAASQGLLYIWFMNGTNIVAIESPGSVSPDWSVVGVGDFNGDGKANILWRHTSGMVYTWLMNGKRAPLDSAADLIPIRQSRITEAKAACAPIPRSRSARDRTPRSAGWSCR